MKFKWITAGCMALIFSIGMFPTMAAAFVDETAGGGYAVTAK